MIDFDEELEKYQPILEINEVEESIESDEMQDILDMLIYISKEKDMSSTWSKRR